MKKTRITLFVMAVVFIALLVALLVRDIYFGDTTPSRVSPTRLYVIDDDSMSEAEKVMIQGLQGILAQSNSSENIWINAGDGYENWLVALEENYGVDLDDTYKDPWGLVDRFRQHLDKGYVVYELGEDSENVATTLAGIYKVLPIASTLVEEVEARNLSQFMNVRGKDEKWCFDNHWDEANHSIVVLQEENKHGSLRDYAVATKAFTFHEGKTRFMREVFNAMSDGGMVLGWGGKGFAGESEFILPASQYNLVTVPADYARNLSVLSAFRLADIAQKNHASDPASEENVHYVTFIMSDGDNVQWLLKDFSVNPDWYGSPLRGDFPMGWTISPSLVDLSPAVMQWLYDNATDKDFFVSGVSGRGYFYPSNFPDLEDEMRRMNEYLEMADLNVVSILDTEYNGFNLENLEPYAAQPNLIGGFWLWYDNYAGRKGDIIFVNGKPFVSAKYNLWQGIDTPESIAAKVNAAPTEPHSIQGYSLINVHPWSMGLPDVKQIVDSLSSNVRVVTPEEFILLMTKNLSPELFWIFSTDTEEWEGEVAGVVDESGNSNDAARWDHVGNPPGCLFLDGSDFFKEEGTAQPNSWFSKEIVLPITAKYLRFETRAAADNDGQLRVMLKDADGWHILLDWDVLFGRQWVSRQASIGQWAGQRVTLKFEQADNGEANGEMRYIDNIEIIVQR